MKLPAHEPTERTWMSGQQHTHRYFMQGITRASLGYTAKARRQDQRHITYIDHAMNARRTNGATTRRRRLSTCRFATSSRCRESAEKEEVAVVTSSRSGSLDTVGAIGSCARQRSMRLARDTAAPTVMPVLDVDTAVRSGTFVTSMNVCNVSGRGQRGKCRERRGCQYQA